MPLSSQAYWQLRALKDYIKVINKTEDFIAKKLAKSYTSASKDIVKDVEALYKKYGDENGLTLQEVKKRLNAVDLKNVNVSDEAFKLKSRTTGLELLQYQVDARVSELYDSAQENVYNYLYNTYEDSYYRALSVAGKEFGADLTLLNKRAVENAILQNWSAKNFSERIWGHREKLGLELKQTITSGLVRGVGVDKMARDIRKRMDVKLSDAKRLVRTESNYCFNKGSLDGYIESGVVEFFQFLATLDNRTSPMCINLDGKVFPLEEAETGKNCPPMHPNCRSTTVAYFGDVSGKKRRAKADDKSYLVDADLNYKDWYTGLLDSQRNNMEIDLKMQRNKTADKVQFQKYKDILGKDAPGTFAMFQDIKYTDKEAYEDLKDFSRYMRYNPDSDKNFFEINKKIKEEIANGVITESIGTAVKPIPENIVSIGRHAEKQMLRRNVSLDDAQDFINNAVVMFRQDGGKKQMYYSEDGAAGVILDDKILITSFPESGFDPGARKIIEVSKNE